MSNNQIDVFYTQINRKKYNIHQEITIPEHYALMATQMR